MLRQVKVSGRIISYELMKTARRSIELRVLPTGVRCYAPSRCALKDIDAYVGSQADWIDEARRRLNAYAEGERAQFPMTDGMTLPLEGDIVTLRICHAEKFSARREGSLLYLSMPDLSFETVSACLRGWLIEQARARIDERLAYYIPLIGRSPNRVAIREQRTKWGSCSSQRNLNFNWKLIMAPKEALDYVVIHELCHLYEFNHSEQFWKRVERYQSDYAVWRDFLRSGWAHPYR